MLVLLSLLVSFQVARVMASLSPQERQSQEKYLRQNRVASIIVAGSIMLAAAYLTVALRFVSRRLMHLKLGADDWMMVLGLVCSDFKESLEIAFSDAYQFFTSCVVVGCVVSESQCLVLSSQHQT